jgi:hypothetical protein
VVLRVHEEVEDLDDGVLFQVGIGAGGKQEPTDHLVCVRGHQRMQAGWYVPAEDVRPARLDVGSGRQVSLVADA